jgi:hypothetical protein
MNKKELEEETFIFTSDGTRETREEDVECTLDVGTTNCCPGCGFPMQSRRGKVICFNCGYFESCCGG